MQNLISLNAGTVKLNVSATGNFAYATTTLNGKAFKFRSRRYQSIEFICLYGKYQVRGLTTPENTFMDVMTTCLSLVGLK